MALLFMVSFISCLVLFRSGFGERTGKKEYSLSTGHRTGSRQDFFCLAASVQVQLLKLPAMQYAYFNNSVLSSRKSDTLVQSIT